VSLTSTFNHEVVKTYLSEVNVPIIDTQGVTISADAMSFRDRFEDFVYAAADSLSISNQLETNIPSLTLTADPIVHEGGEITYTATLSRAVQSQLTVTLSNSSLIVIPVNQTSGSIVVQVQDDDVYIDPETVSVTIASASGGNISISGVAAITEIVDTSDTTTLTMIGFDAVEGSPASYTLALSNLALALDGDVTVHLNYGGTAINGTDFVGPTSVTIPSGSNAVTFSIETLDDTLVEGTESLIVSIVSGSGGNFENLILIGDTVTTVIVDNDQ
jgi:surface adhesion protein